MDECQIVMGEEAGAEIRALAEKLIGGPCWCIAAPVQCPILHPGSLSRPGPSQRREVWPHRPLPSTGAQQARDTEAWRSRAG